MASKYWIKLYHEILDDPKMGLLPDNVWRRAIELFLLAGELDNDGQLPDTRGIAWKLRIPCNETLQKELQTLQECNILALQDDNTWLVTHFSSRQSKVEVVDRVRQFRKRQREKAEKSPVIKPEKENVTKRYIDTDTDTDTDTSTKVEGDKSPPPIDEPLPAIPEIEPSPEQPTEEIEKPSKHPAIQAYRFVANRYPDKATWEMIIGTVGRDPPNIAFWKDVVRDYIACGWNKTNVKTMLEHYERRELPKVHQKNGATHGPKRTQQPNQQNSGTDPPDGVGADAWAKIKATLGGT